MMDKELAQYLVHTFCKEKGIELETHPQYPNWYIVPLAHVHTVREEIKRYNAERKKTDIQDKPMQMDGVERPPFDVIDVNEN